MIVNKICRWLDSNRGSLVLEATIRPPNQLSHNHYPYLNCFVKVRLTLQETGYLSRSVFSAINWPIPLKRMAREGLEIMKTLWKCLNVGLMRKTGHLFTYQVKRSNPVGRPCTKSLTIFDQTSSVLSRSDYGEIIVIISLG